MRTMIAIIFKLVRCQWLVRAQGYHGPQEMLVEIVASPPRQLGAGETAEPGVGWTGAVVLQCVSYRRRHTLEWVQVLSDV